MIELIKEGVYLLKGDKLVLESDKSQLSGFTDDELDIENAKMASISYDILKSHNQGNSMDDLNIKFDALASHDITYVGIIQTAKASGLKEFPIPYVLTNCHNSLCAVGGTINEDDHMFGLSAAQKYGGIYVPPHQAVIHQYMREKMAGCGKMILGSDSHTRYGALGTMAMGEGGPELVKQILSKTYDLKYPKVVCVYLKGNVSDAVGPQDVALSIIGKVFKEGFVKNKVLEFVGPGVENLSIEFRNGVDVMTTETTCLSSIWKTDSKVEYYLETHKRKDDYKELTTGDVAYYNSAIVVDLDTIEPMIALPFHPSNVFTIRELTENPHEILKSVEEDSKSIFSNSEIKLDLVSKIKDGKIMVDQGIIAGCAGGTFENIAIVADMMEGKSTGCEDFTLNVYPASQPAFFELNKIGSINKLMETGAIIKTAFCGPCFGAGDVPAHNSFSIRHTTRNFPNREGSKPSDGQISAVALMDAKSIAATAMNGGILTSAADVLIEKTVFDYNFNDTIYKNRVFDGYKLPEVAKPLSLGPNIKPWPTMIEMPKNLAIKLACVITDPVTTTDELIPSGETSSYRSNPILLSEFTLSRKDPKYVARSKATRDMEDNRAAIVSDKSISAKESLDEMFTLISGVTGTSKEDLYSTTAIGSGIYAHKPGDGSAREQAASCQKVLGGWANIAQEYATKRYRSNCINWGIIPFTIDEDFEFEMNDILFISNIDALLKSTSETIEAVIIRGDEMTSIDLFIKDMTQSEREVLLAGCLINYYKKQLLK